MKDDAALASAIADAERLVITDLARALEVTGRLVATLDPAAGSEHAVSARRVYAQALAYANRFEEAMQVLGEAVEIAERLIQPVPAAHARLTSLHPLARLGRFREAIEVGVAARDAFLDAGEILLSAKADINLGVVHRMNDDPAAALSHFDRAREVVESEPALLAQLDSNRAEALLDLDRFHEAEAAFHSALDSFVHAGMHRASAIVAGNLADLASRQGCLDDALAGFQRARIHLENEEAAGDLGRLLAEEAEVLVTVGMLHEALELYRSALPQLEAHGMAFEAARARAGLGRALMMCGEEPQAAAALEEAAVAFKRLEHVTGYARTRLLQGNLAMHRARYASAHAALSEAHALLADRPVESRVVAWRRARVALETGQLEAADEFFQQALREFPSRGLAPMQAEILRDRSRLRQLQRRHDEALADLRQAAECVEGVLQTLPAETIGIAFLGGRISLFGDLVLSLIERGGERGAREAFEVSESGRCRGLFALLQRALRRSGPSAPAAASPANVEALLDEALRLRRELAGRYSRLLDLSSAVDSPRWMEDVGRQERRLEELERRLDILQGPRSLFAAPAHAASVQAAMDPASAMVCYYAAGDELLAFILSREELSVRRRLAKTGEVIDAVEEYQFQINRAMASRVTGSAFDPWLLEDITAISRRLHQLLIAPVFDLVAGRKRVIIVPHGALHAIPFHALEGQDGALIDEMTVAYAPSATVAHHLLSQPPGARPGRPLLVSVADEQAPGIREETRQLKAVLADAVLLADDQAVAERVRDAVAGASVIHFACHGRFSSAAPMASGLKLHDRWLTVREIHDLPLQGAVVTLSACETAAGVIEGGDELYGLARAFLAAGARSLVLSLWPVDDESGLMTLAWTYQFWHNGNEFGHGCSMAEALRLAQLRMRVRRPHPFYWSPFLVIGGR